jgi:nucleoside-diphosphate-sugar epimerase
MPGARKPAALVTGVAGFIGSNLAERLIAEGYRVVGIDNLAYGVIEQVPDQVEFHELDIRSSDIYRHFSGVDAVFHLAAKNCIADCQADPVETASINVLGSVNVFEAARQARTPKVVYAESASLYEGSKVLPSPESESAPESFYAVSKYAERVFADAYERYHDMRLTALRYFGVYGPRQDYRRTIPPLMSAFIIKLLKGERPTIYGTGEKRRDFIYVDDVNDFHMQCLTDRRTDGKVFNLANGQSHSVLEILDMVQRMLGTSVKPEFKPDLPGEAFETLGDVSAARAIGWKPKVSLEEGLRRSIAFIRENVVEADKALARA